MSEFRVAASTFPFLYAKTGLETLRHLRAQGYTNYEMMIFPPHCWPREMSAADKREVSEFLDGEGAAITSFCYPLLDNNPNSVCSEMRRYTMDRYREAIDLAAEWGCPEVVAIPGPVNSLINPPYDWMRKWFVEAAAEMNEHARKAGVGILLENVPFTFLPTAYDMKAVADEIGGGVGINYDVCNGAFIDEDVGKAIRDLGSLIRNVHISDSGKAEFKHDRLGTGIVDPAPAAEALRDIGYEGLTVLEIITDATQEGADPDEDLRVSHEILAGHGWEGVPS